MSCAFFIFLGKAKLNGEQITCLNIHFPALYHIFILMTPNLHIQPDPSPGLHNILFKGILDISTKTLKKHFLLNMSKT